MDTKSSRTEFSSTEDNSFFTGERKGAQEEKAVFNLLNKTRIPTDLIPLIKDFNKCCEISARTIPLLSLEIYKCHVLNEFENIEFTMNSDRVNIIINRFLSIDIRLKNKCTLLIHLKLDFKREQLVVNVGSKTVITTNRFPKLESVLSDVVDTIKKKIDAKRKKCVPPCSNVQDLRTAISACDSFIDCIRIFFTG